MSAAALVPPPAVPGEGPVPAVGPLRPPPLPAAAERVLPPGLRVVAVRRAGAGVAEVRLRVPFAAPDRLHTATGHLLAETVLTGTPRHDRAGLAAALQALGAEVGAGVDADRLVLSGNGLADRLPDLLGLLGEVLADATHPDAEVALERDRMTSELAVARSQPSVIAREALLGRLHGDHPYARELPLAEEVAEVDAAAVRALHAARLRPEGALLVVVADREPEEVLDLAGSALAPWLAVGPGGGGEAAPGPLRAGGLLLVDRPGAVQSTLRLAGPALGRSDPSYAALVLANLVFGGYFSSRLVANIREKRGYTYSPNSSIEHPRAGSRLVVGADVSTAVTAPALLETRYELGRIATLPVEEPELAAARRYASGVLALTTATAADLASTLVALLTAGVGLAWLHEHPAALEAATADDVLAAARAHLAPARLTTVVVGDAALVRPGLEALDTVEVEAGAGV